MTRSLPTDRTATFLDAATVRLQAASASINFIFHYFMLVLNLNIYFYYLQSVYNITIYNKLSVFIEGKKSI